jgi:hypothetical protein
MNCGVLQQERIGNKRCPGEPGFHGSPDSGGGRIFCIGIFCVVASLPDDHQRLHSTVLGQDGLAVFHGEDVVRPEYKLRIGSQSFQSSLTGSREGDSLIQLAAKQGRKLGTQQDPGGVHQGSGIAAFAAKAQIVAERAQNGHASGGEALCGGKHIRGGQFQHQIRSGQHRSPGPKGLVHDGRVAPLDIIAAHQADNGCVLAEIFLDPTDLLVMPPVEGVIFAYDSDDFQKNPSFFIKFSFLGLEKSGIMTYNNLSSVHHIIKHQKIKQYFLGGRFQ